MNGLATATRDEGVALALRFTSVRVAKWNVKRDAQKHAHREKGTGPVDHMFAPKQSTAFSERVKYAKIKNSLSPTLSPSLTVIRIVAMGE